MQIANEIVAVQKDYVAIGEKYIAPFKAYEEFNVAIAGVSNYMYSDPGKYVSELEKYIGQHDDIYQQFKGMQPAGWFVEGHDVLLKSIDATTGLLESMKDAVGKRSQQDIIAATQKFEEVMQTINTDSEKAEDTFDKKAKELSDRLEDAFNDVEDEYDNVKAQYKL